MNNAFADTAYEKWPLASLISILFCNVISSVKIPFLRAVERTLAQFGPYYYDPHWNDDGDNGDNWKPRPCPS